MRQASKGQASRAIRIARPNSLRCQRLHRTPLGAGLLAAVALAACGGAASTANGPAQTVPIGMVISESGAFGQGGTYAVTGAQIAVDKVDGAGGFTVAGKTYKFSLVPIDDKTDNQAAVAAATQLIRDDSVKFILGPYGGMAVSVAPVAAQRAVLNFTPSSSISKLLGTADYPGLFLTLPSVTSKANVALAAIKSFVPGVRKVAIVGPSDSTAQANVPTLHQTLQSAGMTVDDFLYPPSTVDLSSVMTKVVADQPDLVYAGFAPNDVSNVLHQIDAAGLPKTTTILGHSAGIAVASQAGGRPFIADPLSTVDVTAPTPSPAVAAFVKDLLSRLNLTAMPVAASGAPIFYDVILLLAKGLQTAGSVTDTKAITTALRSITVNGLAGPVSYDSKNQIVTGLDVTFVSGTTSKTVHFNP
jgi:branched-chain amino acid transport system substrate-binding protein